MSHLPAAKFVWRNWLPSTTPRPIVSLGLDDSLHKVACKDMSSDGWGEMACFEVPCSEWCETHGEDAHIPWLPGSLHGYFHTQSSAFRPSETGPKMFGQVTGHGYFLLTVGGARTEDTLPVKKSAWLYGKKAKGVSLKLKALATQGAGKGKVCRCGGGSENKNSFIRLESFSLSTE